MFVKHILASSFIVASALMFTFEANANSRFTLDNQTDKKLMVLIYNGDDSICTTAAKSKNVKAGNSNSYGCEGRGNHRCHIRVYQDKSKVCKSPKNACNSSAIKVPNGSTITVSSAGNDKYDCTVD